MPLSPAEQQLITQFRAHIGDAEIEDLVQAVSAQKARVWTREVTLDQERAVLDTLEQRLMTAVRQAMAALPPSVFSE